MLNNNEKNAVMEKFRKIRPEIPPHSLKSTLIISGEHIPVQLQISS